MREGTKDNTVAANVVPNEGAWYKGHGAAIDDDIRTFKRFVSALSECVNGVYASHAGNETAKVDTQEALREVRALAMRAHHRGNKVIFIGNGGSAAIASHMAVDWTKNGGIRSIALNDAPTLTCLGNDFGYENVFSKQLEYHAQNGDVVVIISSSGKSPNILNAAGQAFAMGLDKITFTGMRPANKLRRTGLWNFYVPCMDYGLVEISHLALLHSIVTVRWK